MPVGVAGQSAGDHRSVGGARTRLDWIIQPTEQHQRTWVHAAHWIAAGAVSVETSLPEPVEDALGDDAARHRRWRNKTVT